MVVYDERGQSTSSAVLKPPMENGRFIKILQEIRQEIEDEAWSMKCIDDDMYELEDKAVDLDDALRIIDTHISALNNDQFERIWNHTVEEMKRRKIGE